MSSGERGEGLDVERVTAAMAAIAAEDATGLLDEAVRLSRADAVQILRARLTPALVEAAEAVLTTRSGAGSGPDTAPAATAQVIHLPQGHRGVPLSGWYVYGLTWERSARSLAISFGVDEAPLQVVTVGSVAAVVSPVSADALWGVDPSGELDLEQLAPRARRHEWVLEQMLDQGAVLPLRFAVMYPTLERLEETLTHRTQDLVEALERVDQRAEWGLTIAIEDTRRPGPTTASARPEGRDYLAGRRAERRAAEARAEERARAAADIHRALTGAATDSVVHSAGPSAGRQHRSIVRASYLVPCQSEIAFRAAAEQELQAADPTLGLVGELTGPWPPYHFCEISLTGVPA